MQTGPLTRTKPTRAANSQPVPKPARVVQAELPSGVETVAFGGVEYATVIRAAAQVDQTTFISSPESSFQFGLLAHQAGFVEPPHRHRGITRAIEDVQQMFVVQRGVVAVRLYSDDGDLIQEVVLESGDAIVLIHGIHALRVIEDMQCISVKQGPFLGTEFDKQFVQVKK